MKEVVENKLQALNKELDQLQNKKITFADLKGYKENYLNIVLAKVQMDHIYKMIEDEDYGITL